MQRELGESKIATPKEAFFVNHIHRKLLGESLREIGVLVLVFVPLDAESA